MGGIRRGSHRRYHTAPVGARSKRGRAMIRCWWTDTTLPLWGRDQNGTLTINFSVAPIPHCPCGGEIKTVDLVRTELRRGYHTAPVGARSKLEHLRPQRSELDTTLPLWGRDQNDVHILCGVTRMIPHCPCGGEIKTDPARWLCATRGYHTAPVGARSKRPCSLHGTSPRRYHTAPVGARSKPDEFGLDRTALDTTLPLWGRDQNLVWTLMRTGMRIPHCPCGGEIKTF